MTTAKSIQATTVSGITLVCAEQGDPTGPALLLVHGYSDSCRSYAPFMAALPATYRTIAVTLRGHGMSDKPDAGYGIDDFADDLVQVMDRCGVADAAVVGHSMGSMVATRLALTHPDRVRALVLIGALATLRGNAAVEPELIQAVAQMADPVDAGFVREFQQGTLARPVADGFLDAIVGESLKAPARVWQAALAGMLDHDLGPELGRVAAPTLIVWGDRDAICDRASQTRLADAIPGAQLWALPGAGHAPHWEDPRKIAAEVASFIDSIGQRGAA